MRRFRTLPVPGTTLLATAMLVIAAASVADAHCCHDSRSLGVAMQSEFRRGLHGLGDGPADDSLQAEPPTIDERLEDGGSANEGIGGLGQMQGNGIGNYGAGSLGERGPGGLGAMRGTGLGARPARPR